MKFQAHRGVSTEAPENTIASVLLAIRQGYDVIEVDCDVTVDMQFALMHDRPIGRTARTSDGKALENAPNIFEITYEELCRYDFGLWFSKKYAGERAPLLVEILKLAAENGVKVKIDNKYRFFDAEQRAAFYALLSDYQEVAQLTCFTLEDLREAVEALPEMSFHYDGVVTDEILAAVSGILPKDKVTIWIPIQNRLTTWVKVAFADQALADKIKNYGKLGLWIISSYEDADFAMSLGADIVETNGLIKPPAEKGIVADMHTHSEHSHDSKCRIEDMLLSQIEKGVNMMAVTDHFDTESYQRYDIHTPIKDSHADARRLNEKYGDKITLLRGVEISEGFWFPAEDEKIHTLDCDVIIGSVHLVKYRELTKAYSGIDFSSLTDEQIHEYMDAYFDDMLTMLREIDFDILAHLTCPLRYICVKHKRQVDMSRYIEKIDKILDLVIKQGKALEVNCALYAMTGEFVPDESIVRRYYEKGGYMVTVGSDAHLAKNASTGAADATAMLKRIGFKHLYYFENRQPIPYEI